MHCDIPVHCVRSSVVGKWEFSLGELGPERSSCDHDKPDMPNRQPGEDTVMPKLNRKVTLSDPNVAQSDDGEVGTWTMVYDEGFEFTLGDQIFFAFSKFTQRGAQSTSHCNQTGVGWYRDSSRTKWGCFYGKKGGEAPTSPAASDVETHAAKSFKALRKRKSIKNYPPSLDHLMNSSEFFKTLPDRKPAKSYESPLSRLMHDEIANELNMLQSDWTATVYDQFVNKSLKEMNLMAGIPRSYSVSQQTVDMKRRKAALLQKKGNLKQGFNRASFRHHHDPDPASILSSDDDALPPDDRDKDDFDMSADSGNDLAGYGLPKSLDWRNHEGKNYIASDGINQRGCGACYAIATVRMLSARHKIRQNNPKSESFSVSFPLNCAEYTQGCSGGYGFLTSKWSEDVGLLPEKCAPYNGGGACEVQCKGDSGARYRASNHRYVGGYYGGASEDSMLSELVHNGPVVAAFEPGVGLMYYKEGIYKTRPDTEKKEWQKVDHAVLIVGYGEEEGKRYWIIQNSWGDEWGQGGFFRMARGDNDSGIESIVVAADVVEDEHPEVLKHFLDSI